MNFFCRTSETVNNSRRTAKEARQLTLAQKCLQSFEPQFWESQYLGFFVQTLCDQPISKKGVHLQDTTIRVRRSFQSFMSLLHRYSSSFGANASDGSFHSTDPRVGDHPAAGRPGPKESTWKRFPPAVGFMRNARPRILSFNLHTEGFVLSLHRHIQGYIRNWKQSSVEAAPESNRTDASTRHSGMDQINSNDRAPHMRVAMNQLGIMMLSVYLFV